MQNLLDEAVLKASAAASSAPNPTTQEIRACAADAILDPVFLKKTDETSMRRGIQLFKHLLTYSPHAALAVCLFGFAWLAASHFSSCESLFCFMEPRSVRSVALQESLESAKMIGTVQKLAEEIRALEANVGSMRATQSLGAKDSPTLAHLNTRLDAAKAETGAAIDAMAGKVEHLQREFATQLSQVNERFDRIEHQVETSLVRASVLKASSPSQIVARKSARGGRGDAFDPSKNPTAPGVPRPLGSLAPAAIPNNPADETAYKQRNN